MASELGKYKTMVDGLTEGGFTDSQTQALVDVMTGVVSGLRDEMHDGFRALDKRIDGVDKRLDGMNERLGGMDKRIDGVDKRLDGMDERFRQIDDRFNRIDDRFDRIEDRFNDRFDKLYDHFDSLKNWLIGGLGTMIVTLIGAILALIVQL